MTASPRPRPGILELEPYLGGEASLAGRNRIVRLASNENPLGASPEAVAAYSSAGTGLHRYPDGGAVALRRAIAGREGIEEERVVCGAGSDELISLLTRAYAGPGDEVLYSAHGFLMYPIAAKAAGARPVAAPEANLTADIDSLLVHVSPATRLAFLANPNNPTGTLLSPTALGELRARLRPDILLVIDAAYAEYVVGAEYDWGWALARDHPNVVVTRTFSKIHGLAGLRLGWAYCPPAVADVLNRVRGPFNVSQPAQEAGIAAMADEAHVARSREHNARWRLWLAERVRALGLETTPSAANFVLVAFPEDGPATAAAAQEFLRGQGILVRNMASYRLPHCLRVTVGTEEEVRAVAEALEEFMG